MEYRKPEVSLLASATEAIQSGEHVKPTGTTLDMPSSNYFTVIAYEADE